MARSLGESKRSQGSVNDTRKSIVPEPVSKVRQRPLKTMNEISAAEAVALFQGVDIDFLGTEAFSGEFPEHIAARDFFECLKLYQDMGSAYGDFEDQLEARIEADANVSDQDLATLTPREKDVFLLQRDERLPRKEIGTKLNMSEETVKSHLSRARSKLNSRLSPKG
jgi:RNA polymerase sigma factor (sigma-70 family)